MSPGPRSRSGLAIVRNAMATASTSRMRRTRSSPRRQPAGSAASASGAFPPFSTPSLWPQAKGAKTHATTDPSRALPSGSDHQSQQGELPMFWTKRVVIGDGERGLVYRNRQFAGVLAPGVYRWFDPFKRIEVNVHNIARPEY